MIDLSFIQDPQWNKKREEAWGLVEPRINDEYRKKELEEVKRYFFTGEPPSNAKISDFGKLIYFPLQSPEGWDYVFQNLVRDPKFFEEQLYQSVFEQTFSILSLEQELRLWDYFLGEGLYQENIKSRVPIGKNQEYVEIKIHHAKHLSNILAHLSTWVEDDQAYGDKPKWVIKKDYFFSMLTGVGNQYFLTAEKRSQEARAGRLLTYLMSNAADSLAGHSYERHRNDFLQLFAHQLDTMDGLCPELKTRWQQVKAESGVA